MFADTIKQIINDSKLTDRTLTQNDIAEILGMTKQSFSNKMQRDTFTVEDMVKISNSLGMKVIVKGEQEYIVE